MVPKGHIPNGLKEKSAVKIPHFENKSVAAINFPFHNGPLIGERKVCSSCRRPFVPDLFTESAYDTVRRMCAQTKYVLKCGLSALSPLEVTSGREGV